jgi:SagB-type dehydrogenase family enzyme
MSEFRTAEAGVMYWDSGQLVWDDYLGHKRLALSPESWELLTWFREWKPLSSLDAFTPPAKARAKRLVVETLVKAGVLVERGGPGARREEQLADAWGTWGPAAQYYYYSTRTKQDTRADGDDATEEWFRANAPFSPSPGFGDDSELPASAVLLGGQCPAEAENPVLHALRARRSCRFYDPDAVLPVEALDAVLTACFRVVSVTPRPRLFTSEVHKPVPSAGGRHPMEIYVAARRVEGINPAAYQYDGFRHALVPVNGHWTSEDAADATLASRWAGDAQVTIYYTAKHARTRWKYQTARAMRSLLLEVGHASEAVYLAAHAVGAEACFVGSVRDSFIEDKLGVDGIHEIVLGSTAVGIPVRNWRERTEFEGPSPRQRREGGTDA